MSRTGKLHARLDALERDYHPLVRDEFASEVEGRISPFLAPWLVVKSVEVDRLQRLAREIESLRRKLHENVPGPVDAVVARFLEAYDQLGTEQSPHRRVELAKQAIEQLDAIRLGEARR